MKVGYTFNCLDVPARLTLLNFLCSCSARAGKATAMENGLIDLCGTVSFIIRILQYSGDKISKILSARWRGGEGGGAKSSDESWHSRIVTGDISSSRLTLKDIGNKKLVCLIQKNSSNYILNSITDLSYLA